MDLSNLHFAYPLILWGMLVIPTLWLIWFCTFSKERDHAHLENFIDKHLLPYLLVKNKDHSGSTWRTLFLWSILWFCLIAALAGPRWSYREVETFSKDQSLIILLDLSESMNATDVKPSRLIRAKQKIEDILNNSQGVKIGLIAFAADPHMITPLTDDKETIRHVLPSIDTNLVHVQGSRLAPTLNMAWDMLEAEPGENKALLMISDGGLEDVSAIMQAKKFSDKNISIYTMGVGTVEGSPLKDQQGNIIKKNGIAILSKLEKEKLNEISRIGKGRYSEVNYTDDELLVLQELSVRANTLMNMGKLNRFWEENFYMMLFPVLPIVLWWFRKGYIFIFIFALLPLGTIEAIEWKDYFKNNDELAKKSFDQGELADAAQTFNDPYRKGVAYYKTGDFAAAEKMFRESNRESVQNSSSYNLGNSLAKQEKFEEAITVYEDLLLKDPEHIRARENLELIKKHLEDQKQNSPDKNNSNKDEKDSKENNSENSEPEKDKNTDDNDNRKDDKEQNSTEDQKDCSDPNENNEKKKESEENESDDSKADDNKDNPSEKNNNNTQQMPDQNPASEDQENLKNGKSQEDLDADLWLNQIKDDPKQFLKNKFYIESKKNKTKEGIDPW